MRPQVKAGGMKPQNHNEPVRVRTGSRQGDGTSTITRRCPRIAAISIRREPKRVSRHGERLEVVRAKPTADSLARP
jgi:hypothetical protein